VGLDVNAVIKKAVNEAVRAERKHFDAAIKKAVADAIEAGRTQAQQRPKDTYKATERRLYAYPDLKDKIENDLSYMYELKEHGLGSRSTDVVRFQKAGVRLSHEELVEGIIQDYTARIADTQFEIAAIDKALNALKDDEYYKIIELKYFQGKSPEEMAKECKCDPSTVWRNQRRLVQRIALRLYGVDAL